MIDVLIIGALGMVYPSYLLWSSYRKTKRDDFEYWLNCDVERHAENMLLSEAIETQFTRREP